ncbi:MAG TPA: amidohydrolase family protein [Candidatus Binatia bacterium]|nr:amidohydrolase family protein [Candidatus Binatia bacterium]
MRNGYKIYDSDTHVAPMAETLAPYFDAKTRARLSDWEQFKVPFRIGWAGEKLEPPFRHRYSFVKRDGWREQLRILGEAAPRETARKHFAKFMGTRYPTPGGSDDDVEARIRDMDEEGVDVQLMMPSPPPATDDIEIETAFIRANHRFTDDFCSKYPMRLKSLIVVTNRAIERSVEDIRRWGSARWAVGIQAHLTVGFPLDHPDLEPIWAAANEAGLCVAHHSFTFGYPGYRDLWDNPFIGRTASHPWAAMRAMSAFFGAGIMDRHPNLRFCVLESGFGWLPFWAARMDDQAEYLSYAVPENLARRPGEYMTSGRFFASLVIHEGEKMAKMVSDFLGDNIIMYSSDYPHAESRFPESADRVLAWKSLGDGVMRKMLWDNAVACFGEP